MRYDTSLPPDLSELAILVVARRWTSHFEWYAHAREGLKAGLSQQVITAIANRETPMLDREAARVVHDFSRSVVESDGQPTPSTPAPPPPLARRAWSIWLACLATTRWWPFTLNVFDIGLPEGETSALEA